MLDVAIVVGEDVALAGALGDAERALLTDPQTSGGLLVACAPDAAAAVLAVFRREGFERAGIIGECVAGHPRVQVDFSRKRECPRCAGIKLKRHFFSAKRRVEVDECPNCGGYWLDAGELAQIRLEKSENANAEATAQSTLSPEVIRYLYRLQADGRANER